jgi:hypothetical protein
MHLHLHVQTPIYQQVLQAGQAESSGNHHCMQEHIIHDESNKHHSAHSNGTLEGISDVRK